MKIIDGALVFEHSSEQGNLGDSMGETARLHRMARLIGKDALAAKLVLSQFRTDIGYIRHPECIWREDDTSGDMFLPWYLEATKEQQNEMCWRTIKKGFRYGNGDFIHPGFLAEITNCAWAREKFALAQARMFELKYRWGDAGNKLEANGDSSADYLNWTMVASTCSKEVRDAIPNSVLKEKFSSYYKPEAPHSPEWFLNIVFSFLDTYFTKGKA